MKDVLFVVCMSLCFFSRTTNAIPNNHGHFPPFFQQEHASRSNRETQVAELLIQLKNNTSCSKKSYRKKFLSNLKDMIKLRLKRIPIQKQIREDNVEIWLLQQHRQYRISEFWDLQKHLEQKHREFFTLQERIDRNNYGISALQEQLNQTNYEIFVLQEQLNKKNHEITILEKQINHKHNELFMLNKKLTNLNFGRQHAKQIGFSNSPSLEKSNNFNKSTVAFM